MTVTTLTEAAEDVRAQRRALVARAMSVRPLEWFVYLVVAGVLLCALVGPLLAPANAFESDIGRAFLAPSGQHWFGTDDQGRDVFWRVVSGARVSVLSALLIVAGYAVIAILVATLATVGGRVVDTVVMAGCDIGLAIPPMVAALGFAAALGPSLRSGIIAMILAGWTISARLLRVIMRTTMEQPFVNGARVIGASTPRLMLRHVLPESLDNLFVKWTSDVGTTIVALSALSFIGVGAQPPSAEWGAMISAAQGYIANAWWAVAAPGAAIVVTASAFGLLGDILQVRRDPALRARPTIASGSVK